MPTHPPKPCFEPGCPHLTHSTYCTIHQKKYNQRYESSRPSASKQGYNYRWKKEREAFLHRNPLCVECMKHNVVTAAAVVDHIEPHKGNMKLFWKVSNWQPLCKGCHNAKTNKERVLQLPGTGVRPLNP